MLFGTIISLHFAQVEKNSTRGANTHRKLRLPDLKVSVAACVQQSASELQLVILTSKCANDTLTRHATDPKIAKRNKTE